VESRRALRLGTPGGLERGDWELSGVDLLRGLGARLPGEGPPMWD